MILSEKIMYAPKEIVIEHRRYKADQGKEQKLDLSWSTHNA
jgi:hypothetical protein